jgi:hypothetical protein
MAKKHFGPDINEFTEKPSQWVTVWWIILAFGIVFFGKVTAVISGILCVG